MTKTSTMRLRSLKWKKSAPDVWASTALERLHCQAFLNAQPGTPKWLSWPKAFHMAQYWRLTK